MSHQDEHARGVSTNSVDLLDVLQWLISGVDFRRIRFRKDCSWTPISLVWAALCWSWSNETNLVERFHCSQRLIRHLQGQQAKRSTSYQAFVKLLRKWTGPLLESLQASLRQRMENLAPEDWRLYGFIVFGVDGTKVELPRTKSNQKTCSIDRDSSNSGRLRRRKSKDAASLKKANHPALFLTTIFHVGLQLPWNWRIGPAHSSERGHALEMLPQLPTGSLLTADAGFVGYTFVQEVMQQGHQLLIRVGSNVRLLKKLGYVRESKQTVYVWPNQAVKKNQPPLVLRLVVVQSSRHPVYLLTSVTSQRTLTDLQVSKIYRSRWGIEVFHRHLKQTFGRRKLSSQCAANSVIELDWSVVGIWAIGTYAVDQLQQSNISPSKLSMAKALGAFRRIARDYLHPKHENESLIQLLAVAIKDEYTRRSKANRDYPRRKRRRKPGKPLIKKAPKKQREHAAKIKQLEKG